jgi:hypothetical protein
MKPRANSQKANKAEISRVMSAMGRRGGRIGGKRRLETMTPEERRVRALNAAKARWGGNKVVKMPAVESKREAGLQKLAAIFEEQLTNLGLSEEQKDARVAEFAAFVDAKVAAAKNAKHSKPLQSAALRARG